MRRIGAVVAVVAVAISGLMVAASSRGVPSGEAGGPALTVDIDLNRILLWVFAFFAVIAVFGAKLERDKRVVRAGQGSVTRLIVGMVVLLAVLMALSPFVREVEPPVVEDVAQEAVAPRVVEPDPDTQGESPTGSATRLVALAAAAAIALLLLGLVTARSDTSGTAASQEQESHAGRDGDPAADTDQALALSGSPRHRVMGAYAHFESEASAAGVARANWETALAHARRVASERELDDKATAELAGLYYRARFSEDAVEETAADRAHELEDSLRHDLRRAR